MAVPVIAITLGDCITEKHFAFSRDVPGLDSVFSLELPEFKAMIEINPNG